MSYNGSGTFQINTSGQPVVAGTVISSTAFNALTADLATGLSTAITKDGQTTTTARIIFAQGTRDNTLTASSAVATDASKNLVSVTNTGTGNNVLATSPTLVTPILGTPASGILTNCTGINYDGFKNRIINGQMQIAQRATSATITAGSTIALGYSTVDRFYVYCTGANVTAAQVAGSGATKNRLQITGAASVTAVGIGQRIEQLNSYDLAGSTATLSVDISNSLLTTVTWTAYYATTADTFGTLASPTRTQISTGTFTVTSTLTNYSAQISIPAAATTGIEIVFTVGAQTSGTWVIGNVQLEKGLTATLFDYRPYGTEFLLAQRYYAQISGGGNVVFGASLQMTGGNNYFAVHTKVPMRTTPSFSSSGTFQILNSADNPMTVSAGPTLRGASADVVSFTFTTSAGATVGNASVGQFGGAGGTLIFSAEL
jgi:hypothetical protein